MWVDELTSWAKLELKTNSQKLLDTDELPVRGNQLMSDRLKSPRSRIEVDRAAIVVK